MGVPVKLSENIFSEVVEDSPIETRRACSASCSTTFSVERSADIFGHFADGVPWVVAERCSEAHQACRAPSVGFQIAQSEVESESVAWFCVGLVLHLHRFV